MEKRSDQDGNALNRNVDQQMGSAPIEAPATGGAKRRTWEGYAEDYRLLSEQLVDVSRQRQELETELRRVKAQRLKDLDRLAAVSRTRDLLEKRAAAQMAKLAAAGARPGEPAQRVAPPPRTADAELPPSEHDGTGTTDHMAAFVARVEERSNVSLSWGDRGWWQRTVRAAQAAHKARRLDDARLYLEAALLTKQTPSLWVQLGHVLRESGQYLDAELAYRRALQARPDDAELLFLSGYCLEMAGAVSNVAAFYTAALERDPKLADRYPHLVDFSARIGQ